MMLKEKSNPWARLKYLYVLPLAAMAVTAFARPEVSNQLDEISAVKVTELSAIQETVETESQLNVVNINSDDDPVKNDPLVLVNGEEISGTILRAINPDRIESIHVLKDAEAIAKYGERAVNGVMLITLKESGPSYSNGLKGSIANVKVAGPFIQVDGKVVDSAGKPVVGASIIIKGTAQGTMSDLNGEFVLDAPDYRPLVVSRLNMKTIEVKPTKNLKVELEAAD